LDTNFQCCFGHKLPMFVWTNLQCIFWTSFHCLLLTQTLQWFLHTNF
jgi:hypothetical protein